MDWERTKTVFILAFLSLNILFIFQLWLLPTFFDPSSYMNSEQIEIKLTELQYKGIEVTAEIPRRTQRLRILTLRSPGLNWEVVARKILGYGTVTVPIPPSTYPVAHRFLSTKGEVVVHGDGHLLYTSKLEPSGGELSAAVAVSTAEAFIIASVGKPEGAVTGRTKQLEDGSWLVEFCQRWRRHNLETSWIEVLVDANGVLEMEYYWADVLGFTGERITTIPATGALTIVSDSLPPGTTITRLYNSWYAKPVYAQQWRSYPTWVVETSDDLRYYVNAFTGNLEGSRSFWQENTPWR